jgi:hypothetical protein
MVILYSISLGNINSADVTLEDQHQRDPNVGFIKFMQNAATIGAVTMDGIPTAMGSNKKAINRTRTAGLISTPHQCKYPSL